MISSPANEAKDVIGEDGRRDDLSAKIGCRIGDVIADKRYVRTMPMRSPANAHLRKQRPKLANISFEISVKNKREK